VQVAGGDPLCRRIDGPKRPKDQSGEKPARGDGEHTDNGEGDETRDQQFVDVGGVLEVRWQSAVVHLAGLFPSRGATKSGEVVQAFGAAGGLAGSA
jgi:hypothetical protein